MNSIPDFMREILNGTSGGEMGEYGDDDAVVSDTGADVDAFNDAFEEVYCEFLSRRAQRGNYLHLGTAVMVDRIRETMDRVQSRYTEKKPARRDDMVELVLAGLEILSTKRKGE